MREKELKQFNKNNLKKNTNIYFIYKNRPKTDKKHIKVMPILM